MTVVASECWSTVSLNLAKRSSARILVPKFDSEFASGLDSRIGIAGSVMEKAQVSFPCLLRSASQTLNIGCPDLLGSVELALSGVSAADEIKSSVGTLGGPGNSESL